MPRILALILAAALLPAIAACREQAPAATPGESTLTKVGQTAPTILCHLVRPCRAEIPHIERELWARCKDRGLAMIGVGRQHTNAELELFVREVGITNPVAGDRDRRAFGLYATQAVPRNVVVGRDGTYQAKWAKALLASAMRCVFSRVETALPSRRAAS